jgi:Mitochondrial ribosomal protein (VAR1)
MTNVTKKIKSIPTYETHKPLDQTLFLAVPESKINTSPVMSTKHYPPSIKEWNNSIYTFHKNNYIKLLPAIDKSIYRLLNTYFNLNPSLNRGNAAVKIIRRRFQKLSMLRLFIGKPEIKHNNNKIVITIYTYNRKKIHFLNKIKKIYNIYTPKNNIVLHDVTNEVARIKGHAKINTYSLKLVKRNLKKKTNLLINIINNKSIFTLFMFLYKNSYLKKTYDVSLPIINKDIINLANPNSVVNKNSFIFKHLCSMLYFNSYIFNSNNLLALKNILKKIYNKKIELNIINLKYLYLDSNIFAEAITRKLIDRKKGVLRVLKLGLKLTKQPYFKLHFHRENVQLNYMFLNSKITELLNINDNIPNIKNKLMFKPKFYAARLFLYHMKQKITNGIRLQGTGRLTKRLTASRSVSKLRYSGSLKNINSSYEGISTVMLRGFVKSNLQYTNINNHNRNGSFGTKVSISVY